MLYLENPQVIQDVTLYPDSDPSLDYVFYVLPLYPRFRRDASNKPVFQLIKFRGGDVSTAPTAPATAGEKGQPDALVPGALPTIDGEIAGGFLTFDTEYAVDAQTQDAIRLSLDEQVRARYLREGRVLPEGFQILLRQPTWTDGDVRLLMEDTNQGLFTCVSKAGKPSLMGNNVSSFAAVLAPWQSTLLVDAVEHTNFTPIQVSYHLKYLAKVPPVRINIYASASDFYGMYKEYGSEINGGGCCSSPDTVVRAITERVVSRNVVRISIDSGGLTLEDKTFKALQEMALGVVQEWIKKQFYKDPPERATKEQLQDIQLQRLQQSDFRDLNIHIEQSATVELSVYPQGTMGSLVAQGEDLKSYIREVDLSADEFYQTRTLGMKVYADFPVAGAAAQPTDILFVEVTAYYGSGPGKSKTWDAAGGGASIANGERWEAEWHKQPGVTEVRWEARIRFREPSREMVLNGICDKTQLNIPVAAPGRARLRLDHIGLPWNLVQYVEAKVSFRQANADPQEIERVFLFDKNTNNEQWFDEAIWVRRTEPFFVTLTYKLSNGNEVQEAEHRNIEVKGDRFDIKSPIDRYLEVPVQALYTPKTWDQDVIDLIYKDPANNYDSKGQLFLSEKGGWRQTWSLPLLDPARQRFEYSWIRRFTDGGSIRSQDVIGAPPGGVFSSEGNATIDIGDPDDEPLLRVTVDPLVLVVGLTEANKTVIRAVVHMKYVQPDGAADVDDHVFSVVKEGVDPAWTWTCQLRDAHKKTYMWWVEYYTKPFSKIQMGSEAAPFTSDEETVVLAPPA